MSDIYKKIETNHGIRYLREHIMSRDISEIRFIGGKWLFYRNNKPCQRDRFHNLIAERFDLDVSDHDQLRVRG